MASSGLRVNLHALRLSLRGTVHSVLRIMSFPKLCLIRTLIQDLLCLATHAYVELVSVRSFAGDFEYYVYTCPLFEIKRKT